MMPKSLLLLLLLPTGADAILSFLLNPLNAIVATFIDESQVCDSLPAAVTGVAGTALTCDCTAEVAPEGFLMFKLIAQAECSAGGLITASVTAESGAVNFWEPLIGGIGVFDPFALSTSVGVAGIPADVGIDAEATLFTVPPTAMLTGAAAGTLSCSVALTQITCGLVCFDLATFAIC